MSYKCMRHRVQSVRVHGTIEKERAELATRSAYLTWGGVEVCAPHRETFQYKAHVQAHGGIHGHTSMVLTSSMGVATWILAHSQP